MKATDREDLIERSIEIEESKHSHNHQVANEYNISCDVSSIIAVCEEVKSNSDHIKTYHYSLGIIFMLIAVMLITISHVLSKYLFVINPNSNPTDIAIFMGLYVPSINYVVGKYQGSNMNIFSYKNNIKIVMLLRVLIGVTNNLGILYSVKLLPLSKTIMILSTTPLCWAVFGSIFLKEHSKKLEIYCIFGACLGIYFLTLNKQDGSNSEETIFGYVLVIICAWLTAGTFVWLRYLSFCKVSVNLVSWMLGSGMLVQGISFWIFSDNKSSFLSYTITDFIILNLIGLLQALFQIAIFIANKYALASQTASIGNVENIFTILTDIPYSTLSIPLWIWKNLGLWKLWLTKKFIKIIPLNLLWTISSIFFVFPI